jgi:hypothetical protein
MVTRNRNLDKRVNWFDRQFVRAQDFVDADDYDLDRRRRHVRLLHTPGVAEGLKVGGTQDDTSVTVSAGTAVDTMGREIVVLTALAPAALPAVTGDVEVYLIYDEVFEDASTDPGVEGFTRIHELPSVAFRDLTADDPVPQSPAAPPVPGTLLARVTLDAGKLTGAPDNGVRAPAGAVIGTATLDGISLRRPDHPAAGYPRITADADTGDVLFLTGSPSAPRMRVSTAGTTVDGLVLREAGDPPTGGTWRADVGTDSVLRFDVNTAKAGDFSTSTGVLALDPGNPGAGSGPSVILGPGGNVPLTTRHIFGKQTDADGADSLYLNWGNGKGVEVGRHDVPSDFLVHGQVQARNYPADDTTPALASVALTSRAAGGAEVTWKLYTAATGGGFGVTPGAFEIWHYKSGATDPRFAIHENGDTYINPNGGRLIIAGVTYTASDAQLKHDIEPVADVLRKVAGMRGVSYRLARSDDRHRVLGVIAQDVERVFPELVTESGRDGYKAVDYGGLTAVLIEAVKELTARVDRLEGRE